MSIEKNPKRRQNNNIINKKAHTLGNAWSMNISEGPRKNCQCNINETFNAFYSLLFLVT
jgi:hypothetical protein